jgi:hypothetical protein
MEPEDRIGEYYSRTENDPMWPSDDPLMILQKTYPSLPPEYITMLRAEMDLFSAKNADYTGGGNSSYSNFDRVSAFLGQYPGLKLSDPSIVAIVYTLKQLDAFLWMKSRGWEGSTEGIDSRLADIVVYMRLIRLMEQENQSAGE